MHHRFFSVSFFFLPKADKSYLPAKERTASRLTYLGENWEKKREEKAKNCNSERCIQNKTWGF